MVRTLYTGVLNGKVQLTIGWLACSFLVLEANEAIRVTADMVRV